MVVCIGVNTVRDVKFQSDLGHRRRLDYAMVGLVDSRQCDDCTPMKASISKHDIQNVFQRDSLLFASLFVSASSGSLYLVLGPLTHRCC
jgi:hypothetical protein